MHIRPEKRDKVDAKSMKGIFLGYDEEGEMDYMIWVPQLQKVVASRVFSLMRLSWLNLFVPLRNITHKKRIFGLLDSEKPAQISVKF